MSGQISSSLSRKLANVPENKAFKKERKQQQIVDIIIAELKKNPNRAKHDVSCIIRCCELIEYLVKKKYHMDKFDIVVKVYNTLFGAMQPAEIEQLKKSIDTIIENKLFKRVAIYHEVYSYLKKVVIHNLLFRSDEPSEQPH
jgi:hypothetical protein